MAANVVDKLSNPLNAFIGGGSATPSEKTEGVTREQSKYDWPALNSEIQNSQENSREVTVLGGGASALSSEASSRTVTAFSNVILSGGEKTSGDLKSKIVTCPDSHDATFGRIEAIAGSRTHTDFGWRLHNGLKDIDDVIDTFDNNSENVKVSRFLTELLDSGFPLGTLAEESSLPTIEGHLTKLDKAVASLISKRPGVVITRVAELLAQRVVL